jgi:polyphosphate kinase 2 (PPK2 family)
MRLTDTALQHCLYHSSTGLSLDPAYDFGLPLHECDVRLKALRSSLDRQQQLLWANNGPTVLVWLQGPDCSGKDGVIRNSLRGLNPQGVRVSGFQKPTDSQRQENFLDRFRDQLPTPGMLTVFNRTPYESLVSDLADGYITDAQAAGRLQQILAFEAQLAKKNIHLIKIYLHISKDEQKKRLQQRFANPEKHWKISAADLTGHQNFTAVQNNWNQAFKQSSTASHPWYIIPANNKPLRNLLFCSLIAQKLETLNLQWPQPELPFALEDLDKP